MFQPVDIFHCLSQSELLHGIDEHELRALQPAPEWMLLRAGETLIRQGDPGSDYYLLVHGRLRAFVTGSDGRERAVGNIRPGEGFGEMALLTEQPRAATVRCKTDCGVIRFSRDTFYHLIRTRPDAALGVMRTITHRLQLAGAGGAAARGASPNIAVVPVSPGVDAAEFSSLLVGALAGYGRSSHVHREIFAGDADLAWRSSAKVFELESGNDFLVFSADARPSEWTRLCLHYADLVLLVADIDAPQAVCQTEAELLVQLDRRMLDRVELVLLHPPSWRRRGGAQAWLEARKVADFHHLRRAAAADMDRLARLLAGRGNGVVLSGGGVRGFAQIGALRALREAGVPIDRIGGSSMGSLIAAQYACGIDLAEIADWNQRLWVEAKSPRDFTLPLLSLMRGRRLQQMLIELFGDRRIEDLPVRYFCLSSDLGRAELVMHDRGVLWQAVRASSSFPVMGPPMFLDGRVLVDGGVLNNMPCDIMRDEFRGHVLAIDVTSQRLRTVAPEWDGQTPSGWSLLWGRINPLSRRPPLPGILEVLIRTATLNSDRMSRETGRIADLLIAPPLDKYAMMQTEAAREIAEIGYRHTVAQLEALDRSGTSAGFYRFAAEPEAPRPAVAQAVSS